MNNPWTEEVFGCRKPIIAMCHLNPLPGDPGFDSGRGMKDVIEWARKDLESLQSGGVDAVMFSNEFSMPYMTKVETVTVAAMARVVGELMARIKVPFGVNVLWDPISSLDLAAATGATFVREVFTGVYASDFGLWNPNCGAIIRHQHSIHAARVKLLFNIVPESASYLAVRDFGDVARSTVFNSNPDGLCVSGLIAGAATDPKILKQVKDAVAGTLVFSNTGVCVGNVAEKLQVADGAIVGTAFKRDGKFNEHVDTERVKLIMSKVKEIRASAA